MHLARKRTNFCFRYFFLVYAYTTVRRGHPPMAATRITARRDRHNVVLARNLVEIYSNTRSTSGKKSRVLLAAAFCESSAHHACVGIPRTTDRLLKEEKRSSATLSDKGRRKKKKIVCCTWSRRREDLCSRQLPSRGSPNLFENGVPLRAS